MAAFPDVYQIVAAPIAISPWRGIGVPFLRTVIEIRYLGDDDEIG